MNIANYDNKINNKEILMISLLEYIFVKINDSEKLFQQICDYLHKCNIIEDDNNYKLSTQAIRDKYMTFINCVLNKKQKHITNKFENSRYQQDYIQLEIIGKGGFGIVYKSLHKYDNNIYAIKKIKFEDIETSENINSLNEVRNLSKLNHENIVRYHTSWMEILERKNKIIPTLFIQMELCKMSLKSYIETRNYNDHMIDENIEIIKIKQILKGVRYIHNNKLIHCDLNTNNILLDENNVIKICDFGIACNEGKTRVFGNELYLAPDVIYTYKSDVYSLGIIFFELLYKVSSQMERCDVIGRLKKGCRFDVKFMDVLMMMTKSNVDERIDLDMCYEIGM